MSVVEQISGAVAPLLAPLGVELLDVEHHGAVIRVVVDEPGGIGLDLLAQATQVVSSALDDADPLPGRYTLEVSSPGVERPLRAPRHFHAAVGEKVTMRVLGGPAARRVTGALVDVDDDGITVAVEMDSASAASQASAAGVAEGDDTDGAGALPLERIAYEHIDRARTVFDWGPAPKPGKGSKPGATKGRNRKAAATAARTTAGGPA